tara:strand:+ start:322 stop:717 length:396 start_codon:yes stop_codon:yes gene_type:complete
MRHFLTIYLAISLVACSIKKNTGKGFINYVSLEKIQDDYFVKNSGILFTGKALKFYENGQIEFEVNYLNGELHGLKKSWHQNGENYEVGEYLKNKKEGKWQRFGENGEYVYEEEFSRGEKIRGSWGFIPKK